jgi:arylsulfatase A-like enzyme
MCSNPNVVMIVLDTARADDVFSASHSVMPTVSTIGSAGTTYRNAFATAPWTLPSHGSIFTGTYPSKHGAHGDNLYLSETNRTLAEAFSAAGYDTLGVSNNTWVTEEFGFGRGFDTFWKGWQYYQSETDLGRIAHELGRPAKIRAAFEHVFDGNPLINAANLCYSQWLQARTDSGAARTTDRVETWLTGARETPFFLFINYLEPHIRYQPPEAHAERFFPNDATYEEALAVRQDPCAHNVGQYELSERDRTLLRALYRGELSYVDDAIARLRRTLEAEGEWENTILVILGDHGENVGDHGVLGHQYNVYDTLLHVPLIVHGGAFSGGPSADDRLVQLPDLVPTLLDVTGIDAPALREQSQARSFSPATAPRREYAISEYISPQPPVETLEARFSTLPDYAHAYDRTLRAIRTDDHKLITGSDGLQELYHVASDPNEAVDRSDEKPDHTARLQHRLDEWLDSFTHADPNTAPTINDATRDRLAELGYM